MISILCAIPKEQIDGTVYFFSYSFQINLSLRLRGDNVSETTAVISNCRFLGNITFDYPEL